MPLPVYQIEKMNKNGQWDNAHTGGPYFDLVDAEREYIHAVKTSKCKVIRLVAYYPHCEKILYEKSKEVVE